MVVLLPWLCSCQLLTKLKDHQCETDQECVELLGASFVCSSAGLCVRADDVDSGTLPLPENWFCLRENLQSFPPLNVEDRSKPPLTVSLQLRDFTSGEVIQDSAGSSCGLFDLDCEEPIEFGLTPDEEGYTNFTVPYGFNGRFRFLVPDRLPAVVYISRPITEDYTEQGAVALSQTVRASLERRSGSEILPDAGLALLVMFDCNDDPAPGIRLVSGDALDSTPFYFDGPFPDADLTETRVTTGLSFNDTPVAIGGFSDRPGLTTYEAYLAATGDLVARVAVDIRANELTVIHTFPGDN